MTQSLNRLVVNSHQDSTGPSSSSLERLENMVLNNWNAWGLEGRCPQSLGWVLLSRSHVQKSVIKFISPVSGLAVAIAKVPNIPGAASQVRIEHRNLQWLSQELSGHPEILGSLPRLLAYVEDEWSVVLLESTIEGVGVTSLLTRASKAGRTEKRNQLLTSCFQWLVEFHSTLRAIPDSRQHGDFSLANLFIMPPDRVGVIDWEDFGDYPPCYDLFAFIYSAAAANTSGAHGTDAQFQYLKSRFENAYFAPTWLSRLTASFVDEYCGRFSLDRAKLCQWLLEYFTLRQARLVEMYGTRNVYARAHGALLESCRQRRPLFLEQ